jgi:hypothetical protein
MDESREGHVSIYSAAYGDSPNHAGLVVVSITSVDFILNLKTEQLKLTSPVCSIKNIGQWNMVFNIILCGGPQHKRHKAAGTTAAGPASTPASTPPGTL